MTKKLKRYLDFKFDYIIGFILMMTGVSMVFTIAYLMGYFLVLLGFISMFFSVSEYRSQSKRWKQ